MPWIRVLAFVPMLIAAKVRREERRLVEWFRERGAFDEERAVAISAGGGITGFVQRRLERAGVIRPAARRYFFDEERYAAFRSRRRMRAFVVLTILVIGIGIGFLTGVITP